MVDEEEILRLLQRHDQKGLENAVKKYHALVYTVIRNILQNASRQDIEECASDVFFELWRSIGAYDPSMCSIKTWIIMLSRRKAIDRFRKNSRENGVLPIDPLFPSKAPGPDESIIQAEDRENLYAQIKMFGADERILLYRRYYLFESCVNIAKDLKIKPDKVRKRLWNVRRKLAKTISKEG